MFILKNAIRHLIYIPTSSSDSGCCGCRTSCSLWSWPGFTLPVVVPQLWVLAPSWSVCGCVPCEPAVPCEADSKECSVLKGGFLPLLLLDFLLFVFCTGVICRIGDTQSELAFTVCILFYFYFFTGLEEERFQTSSTLTWMTSSDSSSPERAAPQMEEQTEGTHTPTRRKSGAAHFKQKQGNS